MTKRKPFYQYHEPVNFRDTWRIFKIMAEFVEGYEFVSKFKGEITFFGSARTKPNNKYYKLAYQTAKLLGKKKHTIITGGGPGIMEAANKGAYDANAESVGLNIQLPTEQVLNKYTKKSWGFHYFFTRKVMLTTPSQAFLYYPGGFGTLDEFFEVMDTVELGKMPKIPVGVIGKSYWGPLKKFLEQGPLEIGSIDKKDLERFKILENPKDAVKMIGKTKERPFFSELTPGIGTKDKESANWRIFRIMAELVEGFEFVTRLKDDVTILGTKSIKPGNPYYEDAYNLAHKLGKQKYTIVTGGGPGIMEAASKGAYEAGAQSVGINMRFDHKVRVNKYITNSLSFYFPFTRKLIITAPSLGFIVFPGGYGTLHQVFEILTLMQTGKIGRIPVILFGKKFWQPFDAFIRNVLVHKFKTIKSEDRQLYNIVDKVEDAVKIIKQVPRSLKK